MITAFVLFVLLLIGVAVALVSGVALLAVRLAFAVVGLAFRILFLPLAVFGLLGGRRARHDVWRHDRWSRGYWRRGAW